MTPNSGYAAAVLVVEIAVVLVEGLAYRVVVPCRWPRALLASLAANGASCAAGLTYYALRG